LAASTSWNPQRLSRPVMGLLYLFTSVYVGLRNTLNSSSLLNPWNQKRRNSQILRPYNPSSSYSTTALLVWPWFPRPYNPQIKKETNLTEE